MALHRFWLILYIQDSVAVRADNEFILSALELHIKLRWNMNKATLARLVLYMDNGTASTARLYGLILRR